ncbi:hypothetical protein BDQ17DRAFT_1334522 [Cyathus striatus]|nr:hypothetical protein BDQ17DRAFT_1334522 [Cyathus striatus]
MAIATNLNKACPSNSEHFDAVKSNPLTERTILKKTEGYVNYGILLESMRNPESPSTLSGWVGHSRVKVTMGDGESTFPIVDNLENIRILKFAHVKDEEYITDFGMLRYLEGAGDKDIVVDEYTKKMESQFFGGCDIC